MAKKIMEPSWQPELVFTPEGFVPDIPEVPESWTGDTRWREEFATDRYRALYHLGFLDRQDWFSASVEYLHRISSRLILGLSRLPDLELSRDRISLETDPGETEAFLQQVPFVLGMEFVDAAWLDGIRQRLLDVFCREIRDYEGPVARYFLDHQAGINVAGRVFFHLVESQDPDFPFAFLATYSTRPARSRRAVHTPLKQALSEFAGDDKALLSLISTVIRASEHSSLMAGLMESGELFSPLRFSAQEAYTFLKELPLYEEAGIMCRVPDWWKRNRARVGLNLVVGEKEPAGVGLAALMDFVPELCLGEDTITEEELRQFLEMAAGLVRYRGNWVEVDREKIQAVLDAFDRVRQLEGSGVLTLGDMLRMELNPGQQLGLPEEMAEVTVTNGQWLQSVREHLSLPVGGAQLEPEDSFAARLRPYQADGFNWLIRMWELGLGACLADDMGLGKTVQVLAFLESVRKAGKGPALLVVPASLIGNWLSETARFAPAMPVRVLHRSAGTAPEAMDINGDTFLNITTYTMVPRLEQLQKVHWECLVLDEAQAIRNAGTRQAKAVKSIPASMRVALTGTPIENRLGDLWSLFDFLNRGLLGTAREFTDFSRGLGEQPGGYQRLRRMIHPFLLRRLKTDRSIISDLPDKLEMNAFATLSKKQVALYQQLLKDVEKKLDTVEGIERRGLVLSSIVKFKQICNHPDQYLGREDYREDLSGKFAQLGEICETIREKRERVLVFTQFRELTEPLAAYLKGIFSREGLVLHGGTPVKKRTEMVRQFNGEEYVPFMVLSLKAGGVGLNLTGASHVIHFDRWWNPAVENQATDRAYRIGQTRNVMVHKFVTRGTIEEKIDALIAGKQKLAGDILESSGEQWITEYSNEELLGILALEGDGA